MAFFDDLSRKVTQTSQSAIQKTKDIADVAKINSVISEEERNLNNFYYQIGKLYMDLHGNDCENQFEALISNIKNTEHKLIDLKQQIQNIKGIKRCDNCGAEIAANALFCNACGSPTPIQPDTSLYNYVKCNTCGNMVNSEMKFCTTCGSPITRPEPVIKGANNNQSIICPNCGASFKSGVAFCTECGFNLSENNN